MALPKRGAGQLFNFVAFDELNEVPDGYGNTQQTFVEQFTLRAGFIWLRGGESVQAARLEGNQPAVVRVRVSDDTDRIRPDWRMRDIKTGVAYAIRGVTLSPDRGYYDVLVQSGTAQ
jgi:hypothetical protein